MKKHQVDAERTILHKDLLHSGKYRHKVERNQKAYRRKEKHKKSPYSQKGDGLFYRNVSRKPIDRREAASVG